MSTCSTRQPIIVIRNSFEKNWALLIFSSNLWYYRHGKLKSSIFHFVSNTAKKVRQGCSIRYYIHLTYQFWHFGKWSEKLETSVRLEHCGCRWYHSLFTFSWSFPWTWSSPSMLFNSSWTKSCIFFLFSSSPARQKAKKYIRQILKPMLQKKPP